MYRNSCNYCTHLKCVVILSIIFNTVQKIVLTKNLCSKDVSGGNLLFKLSAFPLSTFSIIIISGGEKESYRGGESVSGNPPPGGVEDQDQ